ncbi:hypothetical protein P154DRAFT_270864 [Amniculicola lignicola CBS 123094]|uniref:Uncharacterized protein n=1 Tax=Amniculicola lignicola CBS 123094 TaxID=1392246 RepID=A0A6A5WCS9_9PLEO|nr:hypothetical protein P154DRAFT_270864 [Amniculicola lignicola CBS 123094]
MAPSTSRKQCFSPCIAINHCNIRGLRTLHRTKRHPHSFETPFAFSARPLPDRSCFQYLPPVCRNRRSYLEGVVHSCRLSMCQYEQRTEHQTRHVNPTTTYFGCSHMRSIQQSTLGFRVWLSCERGLLEEIDAFPNLMICLSARPTCATRP